MSLAIVPYGASMALIDELPDTLGVSIKPLEQPGDGLVGCDAVVADLRAEMPEVWERFLANCALSRIPVYHVKQIFEMITGRVHIEHLSENQFGSLLIPRVYEVIKRVSDLLLFLLLLPVLAPLMLAIALAIKLDDGGSVLFVQERMGFRGQRFRMLKFRSMAESGGEEGPHHTVDGDTRVTRLGRVLRRHRFDELPQVVNILRGEMSWIGPRPESLPLAEAYEQEVPFYSYRHIVRPGITGWAQVHQGQAAGAEEAFEKLQYDFFYIKHFSPWLDLVVALKTGRILVTGFGAR